MNVTGLLIAPMLQQFDGPTREVGPLGIDADKEQRNDGRPIQLFVTAPCNSTNDHAKQTVDAHEHMQAERRDTRHFDLPWCIPLLSDALR